MRETKHMYIVKNYTHIHTHVSCSIVIHLRFITSESVRTDIDGRVKVLLTNEKVYFVKTSGVPSPESILVCLKFDDVIDCRHLKNG